MNRRQLVHLVSGGIATAALPWTSANAIRPSTPSAIKAIAANAVHPKTRLAIKAIAFDAFPILDPRSMFRPAQRLFPDRGAQLVSVWRTQQFEYQLQRALAGQYVDFRQVTQEALVFAARTLKLDLTSQQRSELMSPLLKLRAWPDVRAALSSLRVSGLRLAFLSNATPRMLHAGIRNSRLEGIFEHVLSTDALRTFKPDRRAYQAAIDAFGLATHEILFVAFAGWDAAGAKWFGYPTFWLNRLALPAEELGTMPDGIGATMDDLLRFLGRSQ